MSLFNEYNNKNIFYLTKYINSINCFQSDPLTSEKIKETLLGDKQKITSPEIVDTILNNNKDGVNLCLLCEDKDGNMIPILNIDDNLPIFTTSAERTWLKYVLSDSKTDIFLNMDKKKREKLSELLNSEMLPKLEEIIDIHGKNRTDCQKYTMLKSLVSYINEQRHVKLSINHTSVDVLPYKLRYNWETDTFSLIALQVSNQNIELFDTADITDVQNSKYGPYKPQDHNNIPLESFFLNLLDKHIEEPIRVEIITRRLSSRNEFSSTDADNRFSHLFSDYEKICYIDKYGSTIVDIYYYDFQYPTIFQKILMMGKYIRVISPEQVKQEIIDTLRKKANY